MFSVLLIISWIKLCSLTHICNEWILFTYLSRVDCSSVTPKREIILRMRSTSKLRNTVTCCFVILEISPQMVIMCVMNKRNSFFIIKKLKLLFKVSEIAWSKKWNRSKHGKMWNMQYDNYALLFPRSIFSFCINHKQKIFLKMRFKLIPDDKLICYKMFEIIITFL